MTIIFLLYGLAFFTLGVAALLESRRESALLLGRQLPWLAAFGLSHSLVEWCEMLLLTETTAATAAILNTLHIFLLPLSALLLIRFGVGLISESGPLPRWLLLFPVVLIVPAVLVATYALVITLAEPNVEVASDIWSRYLLFIPGSLLAAAGFLRQSREVPLSESGKVRNMMRGAALAFGAYALFAGLIVPRAPYGLAPWLNYDLVQEATLIPVQLWRTLAALGVTVFVVRALGIFDFERQQQLDRLADKRDAAEEALHHERERAQKAQLRIQTEARRTAEGWVNSLVEIARLIAHMESVDVVLLHIMQQAQQLLHADTLSLALLDESGERLDLKYQAGSGRAHSLKGGLVLDNQMLMEMLRSGRAYRFPDDVSQVSWYCPTITREVKAAAVVPLQFDGQVVGGLWVARFQSQPFTLNHLFGLENLADQIVIALQHAAMAARLQSVATLEERSRIAREMHDGLAQVLGYLGIQMQTIEAYARRDKKEEVLNEIGKTRENIKLAQDDVRDNILSLRTTLSGEAGLVPALQEYVEEFAIQSETEAQFTNSVANAPSLAPLAEVQLVRIIQEALTNVRKHAQAERVEVALSVEENGLAITVSDDGIGFETAGGERNFGLQTMTERAASVGGHLNIRSTPQEGTEVRLWLPLLQERVKER